MFLFLKQSLSKNPYTAVKPCRDFEIHSGFVFPEMSHHFFNGLHDVKFQVHQVAPKGQVCQGSLLLL